MNNTITLEIQGMTCAGVQEAHVSSWQGDRVAIINEGLPIGGGYIGLENAQLFARLGSKVMIIEQTGQILPTEPPDLTEALEDYRQDEGIAIHTRTSARSVWREGDTVAVESGGEVNTIKGSHIVAATGRPGNTADLGLKKLGLETHGSGYLKVDETLRASRPHIFGAGSRLFTKRQP